MDIRDTKKFEKFIEMCENSIVAAPEGFAARVMAKIKEVNAKKPVKVIPFISRKMRAAVCFCSAAAIMAMAYFGVNDRIFDLAEAFMSADISGRIGDFLDIISKFRFN